MEDATARSLELEQQVQKLAEEFQRGVQEKERMLEDLGITPERLSAFEGKLDPESKAQLAQLRDRMEAELNATAATLSPTTTTAPRVKGMRI